MWNHDLAIPLCSIVGHESLSVATSCGTMLNHPFKATQFDRSATMRGSTQLCVALDNKPGELARLCGALRAGGVTVAALFVSEDADCCWVNFVCDDSAAAERMLEGKNYRFISERVLTITVDHHTTTALERLAIRLADAGININYVYGSTSADAPFTLVLKVDDHDAAMSVLANGSIPTGTRG